MSGTPNRVYLVGAGPGDPGLMTLRGQECLSRADVVIYDYLAGRAVLDSAAPSAELIFVGKKGFSEHVTQPEINACLIEQARRGEGRCIVRLKGGDPFVFGRGGEEALALREAGIPFEVVPGVTAGVAAPAYAGIPVTHRTVASSVTLITGHETPDKDESSIDWEHLAAGTGTLCFYMGIRNLPLIAAKLTRYGRPGTTPVALVRWGTTARQETLVATLETVAQRAEEAHFQAPAIIVVGEVVALREQLAWFEQRPLFGRSVVVTRSREQASALSEGLRALGAEVREYPTIECRTRGVEEAHRRAFSDLAGRGPQTVGRAAGDPSADGAWHPSRWDWVVFTSANGVESFFSLLAAEGLDARALAASQVAVMGPGTAQALGRHGVSVDCMPERFVAESAARALIERGVGEGTRVLLPRAAVARDILPGMLRDVGAQVEVLPVYDTVVPDAPAQTEALVAALRAGEVDAITFSSSSTAKNLVEMLDRAVGEEGRRGLLADAKLVSIGPVTSDTLRGLGLQVSAEADPYTIPGLIAATSAALA